MTVETLNFSEQRTEEVQHIIEKMPSRFGLWISGILLFIFTAMFICGWVIRYPDIINGQIVINTNSSPLKLIAGASGKLKLIGVKSMDDVREGQIIAYIENPTDPEKIIFIDSILKSFKPNNSDIIAIRKKLPYNLSLGELNKDYYEFTNNLQEFANYKLDKFYEKQEFNFLLLLNEQQNSISSAKKRIEMAKNSLGYAHKFYTRDSILFSKKVISESELDKTQMNYLSSKDGLQNAINNFISDNQAAQQTRSKIQELKIQRPEKEKELYLAVISSYNNLIDNIKSWEQKYTFKAYFNGKVQFLKFYKENQYVQSGESVFTLVPKDDKVSGQVTLPAQGSGKIRIGQEVIVKLDNYPYLEYGSITGRIKSISLTTNTIKTEKNDIEAYMVLVDFPNQLKTNYGLKLAFRPEAKGSAEIITKDRKLIHRLFDNLKYVTNK